MKRQIKKFFEQFEDNSINLSGEMHRIIEDLPPKDIKASINLKTPKRKIFVVSLSFLLVLAIAITSSILLLGRNEKNTFYNNIPVSIPTENAIACAVLNYVDVNKGVLVYQRGEQEAFYHNLNNIGKQTKSQTYPFTGIVIRNAHEFIINVSEADEGFISQLCGSGALRTVIAKFDLYDGTVNWNNDEYIIVIEGRKGIFHCLTNGFGIIDGYSGQYYWEFSNHKKIVGQDIVKQWVYPISQVLVNKQDEKFFVKTMQSYQDGSVLEWTYNVEDNSYKYYDEELRYDALDFVRPELRAVVNSSATQQTIIYTDDEGHEHTLSGFILGIKYRGLDGKKETENTCRVFINEGTNLSEPILNFNVGSEIIVSFTDILQPQGIIIATDLKKG